MMRPKSRNVADRLSPAEQAAAFDREKNKVQCKRYWAEHREEINARRRAKYAADKAQRADGTGGGHMSRLPCGWAYRLPRFCEGRKCETCILRKDKQTNKKELTK